jgi:hypothetical protein
MLKKIFGALVYGKEIAAEIVRRVMRMLFS